MMIAGLALLVAAADVPPVMPGRAMASMSVGATVIRPETVSAPAIVRAGESVRVRGAEAASVRVERNAGLIRVTLTY
jgi:hypothetical protein